MPGVSIWWVIDIEAGVSSGLSAALILRRVPPVPPTRSQTRHSISLKCTIFHTRPGTRHHTPEHCTTLHLFGPRIESLHHPTSLTQPTEVRLVSPVNNWKSLERHSPISNVGKLKTSFGFSCCRPETQLNVLWQASTPSRDFYSPDFLFFLVFSILKDKVANYSHVCWIPCWLRKPTKKFKYPS